MNLQDVLFNDDIYSPLFLIAGGVAALLMVNVLRAFALRQAEARNIPMTRVERALKRFERRMRLSWALVGFGSLWFLQLLIERSWAK